jgi:GNAT superfamily N-acetyltransferase
MADNGDRRAVLRAIRTVLAADCACTEQDFLKDGVVVTHAKELARRRRFPFPARPLLVFTMGAGVVLSAHPERAAWLQTNLGHLDRDTIFSAPTIALLAQHVARDQQDLAGPDLKYACSKDDFRPAVVPDHVAISLVEGDDVSDLYQYRGFEEALHYRTDPATGPCGPGCCALSGPRPDMAAAVASRAGEIVGIAGAKADCELMWQIGVDVVEVARGGGIGRALVSRLTELILDSGRIPYYSTAVSNIRSRAVALSLGYRPAWTELYARNRM